MSDDVQQRVDELEAQVESLQEIGLTEGSLEIAMLRKLAYGLADDVDAETGSLAEAVTSAIDRVDELEQENEELRTRLDKLGDIGAEKTSKEQKIAAIVTYADNQRGDDQDAVTVLPKVIKGLVDVRRRYAYDLVDDMVQSYDWAHDSRNLSRYGAVEQDTPRKGVVIDFEGVHGEPVPVNKFTTTAQGTGVAD